MTEDLRYPVGTFDTTSPISPELRNHYVNEISALPGHLRNYTERRSDSQLNTPYRPGGWTVRQIIHHLPDSHLNAYIRFKLALTEQVPTIKTYHENLWAELKDTEMTPISASLNLLDALHERWVILMLSLSERDYERTFLHPDLGEMSLSTMVGLYAWHGRHHLAHIMTLGAREHWS